MFGVHSGNETLFLVSKRLPAAPSLHGNGIVISRNPDLTMGEPQNKCRIQNWQQYPHSKREHYLTCVDMWSHVKLYSDSQFWAVVFGKMCVCFYNPWLLAGLSFHFKVFITKCRRDGSKPKGTRFLGSGKLVYGKHWLERCIDVDNYPYKNASKLRVFLFILRTNTVGHS